MSLRKFITILIMFLAILFSCLKTEAKVVYLFQNESAPYSGYLFDEKSQTQAQIAILQLDEYKKLQDINKKLIENQQLQLSNNETMKWLYLIGGALIGGIVVNTFSK